jgi:hypothetical protein
LHEDDTVPSQSQGVSESQTMAQRRELRAGYRDLIENLSSKCHSGNLVCSNWV